MAAINFILLALGLILQIFLLTLLFRRRMASQVILLTVLLFFYVARSGLLFTLFHHIARSSYANLYSELSLLDLVLQIAVGVELCWHILRSSAKPLLPRALLILIFFLAAAALTGALAAVLPMRTPAPADRGTLFTGFLFLLLFAWSRAVQLAFWRRSVLSGLAVIGIAGVLSQSGKTMAAWRHNAHLFSLWSYGNAGVYLIVLLFWIFRCKGSSLVPKPSGRSEPIPGETAPLRSLNHVS